MSFGLFGFQLAFKARACGKGQCSRCYGPIRKGDLVLTPPGEPLTSMVHRSCWFMPDAAVADTVRARRHATPTPVPVPREQLKLFPLGRRRA